MVAALLCLRCAFGQLLWGITTKRGVGGGLLRDATQRKLRRVAATLQLRRLLVTLGRWTERDMKCRKRRARRWHLLMKLEGSLITQSAAHYGEFTCPNTRRQHLQVLDKDLSEEIWKEKVTPNTIWRWDSHFQSAVVLFIGCRPWDARLAVAPQTTLHFINVTDGKCLFCIQPTVFGLWDEWLDSSEAEMRQVRSPHRPFQTRWWVSRRRELALKKNNKEPLINHTRLSKKRVSITVFALFYNTVSQFLQLDLLLRW